MKLIIVVLALVGLASVTFGALPTMTQVPCHVTVNDWATGVGCAGDTATTGNDSQDTGNNGMEGNQRRNILDTEMAMALPFSCVYSSDLQKGFARVNITAGPGNGTYISGEFTVCNTYGCGESIAERQAIANWLTKFALGTTSTCYESTTPPRLYIEADAICNYRGTYNAAADKCTCSSDIYTGDDCSTTVPPTPGPKRNSASGVAPSVVLAAALAVAYIAA